MLSMLPRPPASALSESLHMSASSETAPLVKYPRTPHLPSSLGMTSDDKMASALTLERMRDGRELVVTEKLDGGNVTWTRDHFYARSVDSGTHAWDAPAKALWASVRHDIPARWRVSGESMYASRSVAYENLPGVFMVFGIWDETNTLLSWDDMVEWCALLALPVVPLLYRGTVFDDAVKAWGKTLDDEVSEGFVVRLAGRISYADFGLSVAKYVRANHVRTSAAWRGRDDFAVNDFATFNRLA